jgi:hypothetical protein
MSSVENYDGLCGIIAPFASSNLQLRCEYETGHHGDHSWEKYREQFIISSHCGCSLEQIREEGFINSVLLHKK